MRIKMKSKRGIKLIAGSEIITLIVATIAIAYLISFNVGVVSGQTTSQDLGDAVYGANNRVTTNQDLIDAEDAPSRLYTPSKVPTYGYGGGYGYNYQRFYTSHTPTPAYGSILKDSSLSTQNSFVLKNPIQYTTSKGAFDINNVYRDGSRYMAKVDGQLVDVTSQIQGEGILDSSGAIEKNALDKPPKAAGSGGFGFIGDIYGFDEAGDSFIQGGSLTDNLVSSAAWGGTAAGIAFTGASLLDVGDATRNAATAALGAGFAVGRFVGNIANGWWGFAAGAAVAIAIFLLMNKKEKSEIVRFECLPWDAPTGGQYCEQCNKQSILPCSEYQCKSLGQGCEIVNPGTDSQECVWINRKDVDPPIVQPWTSALSDKYKYTPDNTKNPPDRGTFIKSLETKTQCVKAFTPFTFGVTTNEPAKCKIDYVRNSDGKVKPFDEMKFFFGGNSLLLRNHTQTLSLPGPNSNGEELTISNDNDYELYVSCQDANGNQNEGEFVFQFCVEEGPDTTPPQIINTNLINGMPVSYNTTSLPLEVYVNEPATCRWDFIDREYASMANTMSCSSSVFEMNAQMLYKCKTTLSGIKDRSENKYYIRCLDNPQGAENERNPNLQSYIFRVIGTQPLLITDVAPNETIRDSANVVKVNLEVETFAGYDEGKSNCYYSLTGETDSYILFFSDQNYDTLAHIQELHLPEGNYNYFLKCVDLGGNTDNETVQFRVETDNEAPIVTRIYNEENKLKIITNEVSECVYSKESCTYLYEDGIKMTLTGTDENQHYTDWNVNTNYYIKCSDEYLNQPLPNECSIIARPFTNVVAVEEEN